jgi:hypothetical protein
MLIEVEHQPLFFVGVKGHFSGAFEKHRAVPSRKGFVATSNQLMRLVDGKPVVSHLRR